MDLGALMQVLQKYQGHDYRAFQAVMNNRPKPPRGVFTRAILPTRSGRATQSLAYTDFVAVFDRDYMDEVKVFCAIGPVYINSRIGLDITSEDGSVVIGDTNKSHVYRLMESLGEAIAKTEGSSFRDASLNDALRLWHKHDLLPTHTFYAHSESMEPDDITGAIGRVVGSRAKFEGLMAHEIHQIEKDRLRQVDRIKGYIQSASVPVSLN